MSQSGWFCAIVVTSVQIIACERTGKVVENATPQSGSCPIIRQQDPDFNPSKWRRITMNTLSLAEQTAQTRAEWAARAPSWVARLPNTGVITVPSSITLQPDGFIRVSVDRTQAVIIDASFIQERADVSFVSLINGKPLGTVLSRNLEAPREHVIQVYPPPDHLAATEIVVWLARGTAQLKLTSVTRNASGDAEFPCGLGLGEEPLGTGPNCGQERVYSLQQRVDSVDAAIQVMRNAYVHKEFCIGESIAAADAVPIRNLGQMSVTVDWESMAKGIRVRHLGSRTMYEWPYSVGSCGPGSYWFKVTSDGWISVYGCCGV